MPKLKTNKSAKKRFKVSANGIVQFRPAGHRHLMSAKNAKKRRHSRKWRKFESKHDVRDVWQMLGARPKTTPSPAPEGQKPASAVPSKSEGAVKATAGKPAEKK